MKLAVVIFCLASAASAQFNSGKYNPQQVNRNYNAYSTPAPIRARPASIAPVVNISPARFAVTPAPTRAQLPVAKVASNDVQAEILKFGNEIAPDGSYNYFYEISNGIAAQEQGTPRAVGGNPPETPVVAQGSFSYTSPEGLPVSITYIADENGFQPHGDVLPTPPPIPEEIVRALEFIAKNPPRQ